MDGDEWLDDIVDAYGADDISLFRNVGGRGFRPQERYGVDGEVRQIVSADCQVSVKTGH